MNTKVARDVTSISIQMQELAVTARQETSGTTLNGKKKMRRDSEMVNLRSVVEMLCYMVDEGSDGVEEILQLPTIDLVKCKECRHHEDFPTGTSPLTCSLSWGGVFENDYCSYGERKNNNE